MQLQKIIIKGFKSFADKTHITIESGVVGIVGPNGCGKSNISDAIKWVLGEQSSKTLRGQGMEDVIFSGSLHRKKSNVAEVTLIFDNTSKQVNLNFSEIAITRRLYRGDGKNEYFINKERVRLKDLQDLTFDVGLGKGTLGIISQGMIANFAEAKPIDRRMIFEEAANVSKYKKRKDESIRKLSKVDVNLQRVNDIVFELEKQLKPLAKQAKKAKLYLDVKGQLQKKEVAYLVYEISKLKQSLNDALVKKKELLLSNDKLSNVFQVQKTHLTNLDSQIQQADEAISKLQTQFIEVSNHIREMETLQNQKLLSTKNNNNQPEFRTQEIIDQSKELKKNIVINNQQIEANQKEIDVILTNLEVVKKNRQSFINKNEALWEKNQSLKLTNEVDHKNLHKSAHLPYSVLKISENQDLFLGYQGVVKDLIKPQQGYENALNALLLPVENQIIIDYKKSAQLAIEFLQKNRAGRATFVPLDNIKDFVIHEDNLIAASTVDGYLGEVKDFTNYEPAIARAVRYFLGNTLLVKDFQTALDLQKTLPSKLKIVTLAGEVFNTRGSIAGGYIKKRLNIEDLKAKIKKTSDQIEENISTINYNKTKIHNLEIEENNFVNKINQLKINIGRFKDVIEIKNQSLNALNQEYKNLTGLKLIANQDYKNLDFKEIDKQTQVRNKLQLEIKTLQLSKEELLTKKMGISNEVSEQEKDIRSIEKQLNNIEIETNKYNYILSKNLKILAEQYQLTFEHAKNNSEELDDVKASEKLVIKLRNELKAIGNVDIESISTFKEAKDRYDKLKHNHNELNGARQILLETIKEMDEKVKSNFGKTFNAINHHFQAIFQSLFGGGVANLEYSDFNNILESGIEVKAQPPGKKITNLNLLSGGEKSLVALAVLFAILKVNPLPLCVLDEVESALDIVNLNRFAQYLNNFDDKTQFLIITHRSQTMAKCQNIYGVTMEEKGVSKLLSVKLHDPLIQNLEKQTSNKQ